MHFEPITTGDLDEIRHLQPSDWSDIIPDLTFYLHSGFCFPLKVTVDKVIAGIGVAIVYGGSAWLAHIIVDAGFRNRGIGSLMVRELLKTIQHSSVDTCLLTATEMGRPVYNKAGFRVVTEYVFMTREGSGNEYPGTEKIIGFQEKYRSALLQLDKQATGENRECLLSGFLPEARLYVEDGILLGYYLPGLKEGPVVATTPEAGMGLLRIKCNRVERVVLPAENSKGIAFLRDNGFAVSPTKGTRMLLGKDLYWKPDCIYSRIGGNFG